MALGQEHQDSHHYDSKAQAVAIAQPIGFEPEVPLSSPTAAYVPNDPPIVQAKPSPNDPPIVQAKPY